MSTNKPPPKVHHLLIKANKLTVFLSLPPTTTLAAVKTEVCGALKSGLAEPGIPDVDSTDDFEICRQVGKEYKVLEATGKRTLKELGIAGWEVLFLRFVVEGTLQPVQVTLPSIDEDEPDLVDPPPANAEPTGRKKRKGRDDDD